MAQLSNVLRFGETKITTAFFDSAQAQSRGLRKQCRIGLNRIDFHHHSAQFYVHFKIVFNVIWVVQ